MDDSPDFFTYQFYDPMTNSYTGLNWIFNISLTLKKPKFLPDLQSISIPYPFGFVGWDGRERKVFSINRILSMSMNLLQLVLSRELDTEANETPMEAYALFNTKTNEWYTDASHIDHVSVVFLLFFVTNLERMPYNF